MLVLLAALAALLSNAACTSKGTEMSVLTGEFGWTTGPAVLEPAPAGGESWHSVKDPSLVRYQDRWHLFCTVRGTQRSHAILYLSFADWDAAVTAPRHVLPCHAGYFCAPQVLYFSPQRRWYLICQASDESWTPNYQAAFATTADLSDFASWSALAPLGARPADGKAGLDFWVICDPTTAHLYFTTLDGRLWHESTSLADFPGGWSEPDLAIEGDIFEASHTYRLAGLDRYLTLVEAQNGHGWRYYKAYVAVALTGPWMALAAERDRAFASMGNVRPTAGRWTDVISHGELLRAGFDERLEVDPADLRFLFQGVADREREGKTYGQIPWRLGLLQPEPPR